MRTFFGLVVLALVATAARGATIIVPPGPGTPVQDAINAANPGDTIRLTNASYPEHLQITKAIKLRGVRSTSTEAGQTTQLGGGCGIGPTIDVQADGVQLRGIQIFADTLGGVNVVGRDRIKMTDVFAAAQCEQVNAPMFNIDGVHRAKLNKVWGAGSAVQTIPATVRVANISQFGRVRLTKSIVGNGEIGLLLENNGIGAVRVGGCNINFNERGLVLQNTSRAVIDHNKMINNSVSGIELDATSSGNLLVRNEISGSPTDVSDAGAQNCWRNNVYTTGSVTTCP